MKDFNKENRFGGNKGGDRGGNRFGKPAFGKPSFGPKPMFEATCADCGKKCEVPFRPTGERPVYCRDCFSQKDGASTGNFLKKEFSNTRYNAPRPATPERFAPRPEAPDRRIDDIKRQLDMLNSKLDQLIRVSKPTEMPAAAPIALKAIAAVKTKAAKKPATSKTKKKK